jgi:hypothetical protein
MSCSPYDKIPSGFTTLQLLAGLYLIFKFVIGNDDLLENPVSAIAVQEQGLMATGDKAGIKLWDNSRCIRRIEDGSSKMLALAFSRDGQRLASGSQDGALKVWSVADGKVLSITYCHPAAVRSVAFSQSGDYVISVSESDSLIIWDWNKQLGWVLEVNQPYFSINEADLLTYIGSDLTLNLLDLKAMEIVASYPGMSGIPRFMPEDTTIALYKGSKVFQFINSSDGAVVNEFETYYHNIADFLVAPDGKTFVLKCRQGDAHIWDVSANTFISTLGGDRKIGVDELAIRGDSSLLTTSVNTITLWDLPNGGFKTDIIQAAPRPGYKGCGFLASFMTLALLTGFAVLFLDKENKSAAAAILITLSVWAIVLIFFAGTLDEKILPFVLIPVLLAALSLAWPQSASAISWIALMLSVLLTLTVYLYMFAILTSPVVFLSGYVALRRGRKRYSTWLPISLALIGCCLFSILFSLSH